MIKLRQIIDDLIYVKKSRGTCAALIRMVGILRERLFFHSNEVILLSRTLEDIRQIQKASFRDIVVRQATWEDMDLFRSIDRPAVIERYKTLLQEGRVCLIALKDEQIIAYTWFTPETNPSIEHSYVPLSQGEVYVFAVNTPPAFRSQGFQFMLQQRMLQLLLEEGYKRAFVLVQADNTASLGLFEKLGYEVVSHLTRTSAFGIVRSRYHPNIFEKEGDLIACFSYPIWRRRKPGQGQG
jgi:ribosomal protein S18 acetylase RimI-like enzyme